MVDCLLTVAVALCAMIYLVSLDPTITENFKIEESKLKLCLVESRRNGSSRFIANALALVIGGG